MPREPISQSCRGPTDGSRWKRKDSPIGFVATSALRWRVGIRRPGPDSASGRNPAAWMTMVRVLVIGETSWPEFWPCVLLLSGLGGVRLRCRPSLAAAADGRGEHDLVLILQRYPGEHRPGDLERLRCRLPLARFAVVLGSWCEGEGRSGQPLPGVLRFYWHQWLSAAEEQLRLFREGRNRAWNLPPTAADEDLVLAESEAAAAARGRQAEGRDSKTDAPILLVISRDYAVFEWLRGAAELWKMKPRWSRDGEGLRSLPAETAAVVIDVERDERPRPRRIGLRQAGGSGRATVPVVFLIGFPRLHERERLLRAGATAVLSKPCSLGDLERVIVPRLRDDAASPTETRDGAT